MNELPTSDRPSSSADSEGPEATGPSGPAAGKGGDSGRSASFGATKRAVDWAALSSVGSRAMASALTAAVGVAGLTYGGYRLDLEFRSSPIFLLVGAVLGAVGGFVYLIKELMPDATPWTKRDEAEQSGVTPPAERKSEAGPPSAGGGGPT